MQASLLEKGRRFPQGAVKKTLYAAFILHNEGTVQGIDPADS
jgi:hypothetical protein